MMESSTSIKLCLSYFLATTCDLVILQSPNHVHTLTAMADDCSELYAPFRTMPFHVLSQQSNLHRSSSAIVSLANTRLLLPLASSLCC
uniref:Uncharacterized protein n=1 Tax=Arundo donax TaxID=35708 RepID=A0A0A9C5U4_ARUDO